MVVVDSSVVTWVVACGVVVASVVDGTVVCSVTVVGMVIVVSSGVVAC